jgi:methyl-accepting chemotaxis protein
VLLVLLLLLALLTAQFDMVQPREWLYSAGKAPGRATSADAERLLANNTQAMVEAVQQAIAGPIDAVTALAVQKAIAGPIDAVIKEVQASKGHLDTFLKQVQGSSEHSDTVLKQMQVSTENLGAVQKQMQASDEHSDTLLKQMQASLDLMNNTLQQTAAALQQGLAVITATNPIAGKSYGRWLVGYIAVRLGRGTPVGTFTAGCAIQMLCYIAHSTPWHCRCY